MAELTDSQLLAECEVDTYRGPGPGWQKRNKTESTVLLKHLPTGIQVRCETDRCQNYNREMALVVERKNAEGKPEIIAVGRLSKLHGRNEAEVAALVRDEFQGKGLGSELYRRLLDIAKAEKLKKLHSNMLGENREMRNICTRLGFEIKVPDLEDNLVEAELVLP